jgi:hypothetical protein
MMVFANQLLAAQNAECTHPHTDAAVQQRWARCIARSTGGVTKHNAHIAVARDFSVKISPPMAHGMGPGPSSKNVTKIMTKTMDRMPSDFSSLFCACSVQHPRNSHDCTRRGGADGAPPAGVPHLVRLEVALDDKRHSETDGGDGHAGNAHEHQLPSPSLLHEMHSEACAATVENSRHNPQHTPTPTTTHARTSCQDVDGPHETCAHVSVLNAGVLRPTDEQAWERATASGTTQSHT